MATAAPNLQPDRKLAYYCRTAKLLIRGGTEVLREVLLTKIRPDDIDTFLSHYESTIKLKHFQKYQLNILYPPSKKANIDDFDISLLSELLLKIPVFNLDTRQIQHIKDLKQQRNDLAHSSDAAISEADFKIKWGRIENILVDLATICGQNYRDHIQEEIRKLVGAKLDCHSENDQKYLQMLLQLSIGDIRSDLEDVKSIVLEDREEISNKLDNINANFEMLTTSNEIRIIKSKLDKLSRLVQARNDEAFIKEVDGLVESTMTSIAQDIRFDLNRMDSKLQAVHQRLDEMNQQRSVPVEINIFDKGTKEAVEKKWVSMKNTVVGIFKDKPDKSTKPSKATELQPEKSGQENSDSQHAQVVVCEKQRKANKKTTNRYVDQWQDICETEFSNALEQQHFRGCGPDTVLLLDASKGMTGDKFTQMIKLIKRIIRDIHEIETMADILEENIAIVVLGNPTHILHHLTSNGVALLEALETIDVGGCSPLHGGLRLCHTALNVGDEHRNYKGLLVPKRIILFTDGEITDVSTTAKEKTMSFQELKEDVFTLVDEFACKNLKIFCVPFCPFESIRMEFLEEISHRAKGRVVRPDDYTFLVKYFRRIVIGLRIREKSPGAYDEVFLIETIKKFDRPLTDADLEAVIHIVSDPLSTGIQGNEDTSLYHEVSNKLPPLGTRVSLGKDWRENADDKRDIGTGSGTVVGQGDDGFVWVVWDDKQNNLIYRYKYGKKNFYEVGLILSPYPPKDELCVGNCVISDNQSDDEGNPDFGIIFRSVGIFDTSIGVRWAFGGVQYHSPKTLMALDEFPGEWCFEEDFSQTQ